jgi:maltose O-acetyltransferase
MLGFLWNVVRRAKTRFEDERVYRRWEKMRELGMQLGTSVALPADIWIDMSHCHLISIGDHCGFGPRCLILAHDAQMDEYLDAGRLARVVIHESCHIGAGCIILPGVEIGPRTIVGAGSVVSRSLPPNTVCIGSPAVPIGSIDDYLEKHRRRIERGTTFDFAKYDQDVLTPEGRAEMIAACEKGPVYMLGGHSAELAGGGSTNRTPPPGTRPPRR